MAAFDSNAFDVNAFDEEAFEFQERFGVWFDDTSSAAIAWAGVSDPSASGNWSRFVDADPLSDGEGGVDFANTFSRENPWVFTTIRSILFGSTRNDPT